jgi:glyoxylase I family protein
VPMTESQGPRLQHVGLVVDDPDAAFAFYSDVLGLVPVERPDDAPDPGSWFDLGDGHQLHFWQRSTPTSTLPHFGIEVEDLNATIEAIRAHGLTVYEPEYQEGFGYQAFVFDPSGNLIELNQPD